METVTEQTYQVLITHTPAMKAGNRQLWQATLLGFPSISEEGVSRAQVIAQIERRIVDMVAHAEIVTLQAPALPVTANATDDELTAQGWGDHGLFKDDPEALQIFDEIEQERERNLIGGE
jgi:hypothetical protein